MSSKRLFAGLAWGGRQWGGSLFRGVGGGVEADPVPRAYVPGADRSRATVPGGDLARVTVPGADRSVVTVASFVED